jgi:hypothetical protein
MKNPKKYLIVILFLFTKILISQNITTENAYKLSLMPLKCITQEWPNKTSHLSNQEKDHKLNPSELHPAFFGCLDWHSSVHGHWLLIKILKTFPKIQHADSIKEILNNSFQVDKINTEVEYFRQYAGANTYERTYGWAWLLKLDEELKSENNPEFVKWHKNLQPLTKTIVQLWKEYLPKQTYPNRTGVHPNTAFGLSFAIDWARVNCDTIFEKMIIEKSLSFYFDNKKIPAYLEPDGSDFFSPSLQVADLMRRVLDKKSFKKWFDQYYDKKSILRLCETPTVSDRTDYQIVHLDGLSFSRAWCMKGIAKSLPENNSTAQLFKMKAQQFIDQTLPAIFSQQYEGSHWLASFAFYAMQ